MNSAMLSVNHGGKSRGRPNLEHKKTPPPLAHTMHWGDGVLFDHDT
jgi:hypothetical protein